MSDRLVAMVAKKRLPSPQRVISRYARGRFIDIAFCVVFTGLVTYFITSNHLISRKAVPFVNSQDGTRVGHLPIETYRVKEKQQCADLDALKERSKRRQSDIEAIKAANRNVRIPVCGYSASTLACPSGRNSVGRSGSDGCSLGADEN